jgi:hypothetical protein
MPQFSVEVVAVLERNGISVEDAKADLAYATEVRDLEGAKVMYVGRLCMYTCRRQRIFGQEDLVVEDVWFK